MFYFQKMEDSLYKAMKIGFSLNILSFIDMIWLTYFINSTVWLATGMIFTYRLYILLKNKLFYDLTAIFRIISAQKRFMIHMFVCLFYLPHPQALLSRLSQELRW